MNSYRTSTRFGALTLVAAAAFACRKEPPHERVYTGAGSGAGPVSTPTAAAPPLPAVVEPPAPTESFSKARLLEAVAECALGRYRAIRSLADAYAAASRAHASTPNATTLAAARESWRGVMSAVQEAEVFRFGPAARLSDPGGKDLRDEIYAWPLANRCRVEEQIVARTYESAAFPRSLLNGRTLGAAEYLHFYEGSDTSCGAFSSIVADGTWAALAEEDRVSRRRAYASVVADDVSKRAAALLSAWEPAEGNFRNELATAGAGGGVYPTAQSALNAVSHGLFFVEVEVKDLKLARPLGFAECPSPRCPDAVESPYAHASKAHIAANFVGFRKIFQGCGEGAAGFGFDDWLRAVGAGEIATRMIAALTGAENALTALGDLSLEDAIRTEPARVEALYAALKVLTDALKTEFVTVLDLDLPKTSEGDND